MNSTMLKRLVYVFNPEDNSTEMLTLMTEYFTPGGTTDGVYPVHELSLGNHVTFHISGALITPEKLRDLANKLERAEREAKEIQRENILDSLH